MSKYIVYVSILFLVLLACQNNSSNDSLESFKENMKIEKIEIVNDSNYLISILYPFEISGLPTDYKSYIGKYIKVKITNSGDSTIFLFGKSKFLYPIDSLLVKSISIDSVLYNHDYESYIKPFHVEDNFDEINDSLRPHQEKVGLLYIKEKCQKLKGTMTYGVKDGIKGYKFEKKVFVFNFENPNPN